MANPENGGNGNGNVFGGPEHIPEVLPTDEELDANEASVFEPDTSHQRTDTPPVPDELYMKPEDDIQGGGPAQK